GHKREAEAFHHGDVQRRAAIGAHVAFDRHFSEGVVLAKEAPGDAAEVDLVGQAIVGEQIFWRGNGWAIGEIARRGAENAFAGDELAGNEGGIRELANADIDVDIALDNVDVIIGEGKIDIDVRKAFEEGWEGRR